jgi:hypothetical protein
MAHSDISDVANRDAWRLATNAGYKTRRYRDERPRQFMRKDNDR